MYWLPYSSHTSHHSSQTLLASLNLLCHSKTDSRFIQDGRKAVWSIPYVSMASFFPILKQNFIAYHSSKVSSCPDCIFEIHQLWQSGLGRVYSNCCCSCSFEAEIIKIGQSSHNMYSNNIVNFQESMTILNACTKKVWKLIEGTTYELLFRFHKHISFNLSVVIFDPSAQPISIVDKYSTHSHMFCGNDKSTARHCFSLVNIIDRVHTCRSCLHFV